MPLDPILADYQFLNEQILLGLRMRSITIAVFHSRESYLQKHLILVLPAARHGGNQVGGYLRFDVGLFTRLSAPRLLPLSQLSLEHFRFSEGCEADGGKFSGEVG